MKLRRFILVAVFAAALAAGCATVAPLKVARVNATGQKEMEARVVKVVDGDTMVVSTEAGSLTVRLFGIDAPEMKQPFGPEAKAALAQKVEGKTVRLVCRDGDKYGRAVADVYDGRKWVNLEMVFCGMAWQWKEYSKDVHMAKLEAITRAHRVGLWAQKDPVAPWVYRKEGSR